MGKVFYIMGKSSSGKDTIYKKILDSSAKLNKIVMYTTRPRRNGEADGEEYHFVDLKELERLRVEGKIIEERVYHTLVGDWYYFTVDDRQIDLKNESYLMIGTPDAFQKMKEYLGEDNIVPILVDCDDGVRLSRALQREMKQKEPKYQELCRRFLADAEDFSEKKLKEVGIEKRFLNEDLERCTKEICAYIEELR